MSPAESDIDAIRAIAGSDADGPVVMLNLNRYAPDAGFPDADPYRAYMRVLDGLLAEVGARILWRSPVHGQPVGEQPLDEVLAVWYPNHAAFLALPKAPGGKRNFELRRACVEYAVIHRCRGDFPAGLPGSGAGE